MRRVMAGLHEGPDMRAERVGGAWRIDVRMRDVGAVVGQDTGVYEFDAGSGWVSVGTYPSLGMAALVLDRLKAGTHAYVRPYGTGGEPIPGQVVPFPDATAILAERGFCDAPPAP